MQGVGKALFQRPGLTLPVAGILKPVRSVGDVGQRADIGESALQSVDIAGGAVQRRELPIHPVVANATAFGEGVEQGLDQEQMVIES